MFWYVPYSFGLKWHDDLHTDLNLAVTGANS